MQLIPLAINIGELWGKAWPLLVAILFFGFLILSHEIGHFSAARTFNVYVNEFSLGMGPRLLKFRRKGGETLYSLKAIPFGGSVLMDEDEGSSENPRAFVNQKAWKRFCILIAGAVVNLICGVLIMGVIVGMSPLLQSTRVGEFREEAVSGEYGLLLGDQIVKVNGKRVYSAMDVGFLFTRSRDGTANLVVRRGGKNIKLNQVELLQYVYEDSEEPFYFQDFFLERFEEPSLGLRVRETLGQSVSAVRMVWLSLLDMVTGKFKLRDISGPIGVVSILTDTAQEAQQGAASQDKAKARGALLMLLNLFALISINIGVMNLLPLPALDGGRLVFTAIEMIFRKPVPKRFEGYVHMAGFALLMVFMVVISFSDIWALIKR